MNERIDDLYKQARLEAGYTNGFDATVKDVYRKFAELIIRECAEVAQIYTPDTEELYYGHLIKDKILEHFGVEE